MNLDEARAGIGRKVAYSPYAEPDADDETGVIDSVADHLVFVRYGGQHQAQATNPGDLRFADGKPAEPEARAEWGARCRTCSFRIGPVSEQTARHVAGRGTADGHVIDLVMRTSRRTRSAERQRWHLSRR